MRKFIVFAVVFAMLLTTLPVGMVPASAALPAADWMADNATVRFDGARSTTYNDADPATAWGSGWSSTGSGYGNVKTYSIGGTNRTVLQFYNNGNNATRTVASTAAYGAGDNYLVLDWVMKRATAQDLYHDYTFTDANGLAVDAAFRFDKNTGWEVPIGTKVADFTEGYRYRIIAANNEDGTTHEVYYQYSTDGTTYTTAKTVSAVSGTVSGFGSVSVFMGEWNTAWQHTGLGDFKISSGNYPASAEEATVTVNYVSDSATLVADVATLTRYVGDSYTYTAPATYSVGDSVYQLFEAPQAIEVVSGTNVIDVEYVKIGTFDTANNLITNGGFEDGVTGWTTTAFTKQIVDGEDGFSLNTTNVHSGTYSLAQGTGVSSNAAGSLSTKWAITPGKTYRLTFYIYGSTSAAIQWCTAPLFKETTERTNVIGNYGMSYSPEWTKNTVDFTAGAEDTHIGIKVGWMGGISYDDFSLYEFIPETADVEVNYYNSTDSDNIVRLSGTPVLTPTGYVSGAAGTQSVPVLSAYSIAQPNLIVIDGTTFIKDTTQSNVISIDRVLPEGGTVNLYYREAQIAAAAYGGAAIKTRVGIAPTLPTGDVINVWLEGSDTAGAADSAVEVISWDTSSLDVSAIGQTTACATILGYATPIAVSVTVEDKDAYLIADFDFDSSLTDGGAAAATVTGSPTVSSDRVYGEGSVALSSGNYLALTKADGSNLLAGQSEITIAYFAKVSGKSWTFFAEPNTSGTVYNAENYVGILDHDGNAANITAEKYLGGRGSANSRVVSATGGNTAVWHHTALTIDKNGNEALYVDGVLMASATGGAKLDSIMGESPLCYLGYATWGSGEYASALVDDLKIYSTALNADEIVDISAMPASVTFTVNYTCGGETVFSKSVTEYEGRTYSVAAGGEFYSTATASFYTVDSPVSEVIAADTTVVEVAVTEDTAKIGVVADNFANIYGDNNNNTENMIFLAMTGDTEGATHSPSVDADGAATYTNDDNTAPLGSARAGLLKFNVPASLGDNEAVLMNVYVGSVHAQSGADGRIAAYRLSATGNWSESTANPVTTDAAYNYSGSAIFSRETINGAGWVSFDISEAVLDAIANSESVVEFKLLAPMGGYFIADREKAVLGGAYEGKAAYLEITPGYALTAGANVSKLTKAGSVASATTIIPAGDGAKAYFESTFANYTSEVFVNSTSVTTLDETGATSYDLGAIGEDTSIYFTITDTTPIPDPEITLTAAGVDGGVGTNGMGILRFVTGVSVPEGETVEYYGTYIIPKAIFDGVTGSDETKITVKKTAAIADGKQYSADLKDIPSTMLDTEIYAWSFAKLANYEDIAATVFTATSVNAAAAE